MNNLFKINGLLAAIILMPIILIMVGLIFLATTLKIPLLGILFGVGFILSLSLLKGFVIAEPNQAYVFLLFGQYKGTISDSGFFWVNPFYTKKSISLRVHNLHSAQLKVNDQKGNPIEIAAVVVWRIKDPYKALLNVHHYLNYVDVQIESGIRHLAITHPYDHGDKNVTSLSRGGDVIESELNEELTARMELAGVEILESRISHLAYAQEIAGAMLQRQQAEAIVAARGKIVEGAVSIVKDAIDHLENEKIVTLSQEQRASLVNNLLLVLCSEQRTQPVITM
jgi:regulator of protease activity HflC (stomatin/prohibitin superfamily)